MWLLLLGLGAFLACGASLGAVGEWPGIRPGVWRIAIRATAQDKLPAFIESEERFCSNTMFLFQRYPSVAVIEKDGCRFESRRKAPGQYEVTSTCAVSGVGRGVSKGLVSVTNDQEFEATWETRQKGKTVLREDMKGTWARPCGSD